MLFRLAEAAYLIDRLSALDFEARLSQHRLPVNIVESDTERGDNVVVESYVNVFAA